MLLASCTAVASDAGSEERSDSTARRASDPKSELVALQAQAGWDASLVVDQAPVGIWTVMSQKVYPQFATPEIVALDDLGRLHALWSYSGKWTPVSTVHDGKWLGGIVHADLDPRVPGPELYTGSQNGNLFQVTAHLETFLDSRIIAQLPGREIHTLVGGDLDPSTPGGELIAFTRPGEMHVLRARADGRDGFDDTLVETIASRIRDAVLLPEEAGKAREIATVGRHGCFEVLTLDGGRAQWTTVHSAQTGIGRLAIAPGSTAIQLIVYSVGDDGRVWRSARDANRVWSTEVIYNGPQGMRGCATGRFDADPKAETVAVFGYSKEVELLTRRDGKWSVETLFVDSDKGHWLCAGEFDGRNATDELVTSGYSGRVVLLSRPPGYGLPGVLSRAK